MPAAPQQAPSARNISRSSWSTPSGRHTVCNRALRAATPAAQEWRDRLDDIAPGRFTVMMQVMASGARAAASGGFRARIRDARGQWAALTASPLVGGADEDVAVVIEPVSGDQLVEMLLAAYGLTPREREILSEMAQGKSNAAIASTLILSERAVEKHINSIFSKLSLSEEPAVHRRVKAVLLYLSAG